MVEPEKNPLKRQNTDTAHQTQKQPTPTGPGSNLAQKLAKKTVLKFNTNDEVTYYVTKHGFVDGVIATRDPPYHYNVYNVKLKRSFRVNESRLFKKESKQE